MSIKKFSIKNQFKAPSSGIWQVKGTKYQIIWYSVLYFAIDTFITQSLGDYPTLNSFACSNNFLSVINNIKIFNQLNIHFRITKWSSKYNICLSFRYAFFRLL